MKNNDNIKKYFVAEIESLNRVLISLQASYKEMKPQGPIESLAELKARERFYWGSINPVVELIAGYQEKLDKLEINEILEGN